jgi:hypothetical protein
MSAGRMLGRTPALAAALTVVVFAAGCAENHERSWRRGPNDAYERPSVVVAPQALLFLEYDVNHDRVVDRNELESGIGRSWAEVSHGADSVSLIAVRDWLAQVLGASDLSWSARNFDPNFSAQVTRQEFHDEIVHEYERLNVTRDDRLTRAQLLSALPRETERPRSQQEGGDEGRSRRRRPED